jgi:hypothetical protein
LLVEFPMPARIAVRRVKDGLFKKRIIQLDSPLGQTGLPTENLFVSFSTEYQAVAGRARAHLAIAKGK